MTLEEAKGMMTEESLEKLKNITTTETEVKISDKINNDILMNALCKSVTNELVKKSSLNEKIIKILASSTNTLQENKFKDIVAIIRMKQPNVVCEISILSKSMNDKINAWVFKGSEEDIKFNDIFKYVVDTFEITPQTVRRKLGDVLKPTIVNNVAQLIAKYLNDDITGVNVSINTISRWVNMEEHMIFAEFKEQ